METWQKYLAEALGTLILVGIGTGTILATLTTQTALQAAVPLGFGLALLVALYAVGDVSGGHFNPAVSLGMFLDRRINISDLIGYWISQFAGGILGSVTVMILTSRLSVAATYPQPFPGVDTGGFELFFGEAVFTSVFVLLFLSVTKGGLSNHAKVAIGLALASIHFFAVPLTGSSINPARAFAPLVVGDNVSGGGDIWIYLVAPLLGAVGGWLLYKVVVEGDTGFSDDSKDILEGPVS